MVTVVAVNIKKKCEISMSSQNKLYGTKWNLLSGLFCLEFVVLVFALKFCFLKLEELIRMQCGVKVK
jgi:hypothetical protein